MTTTPPALGARTRAAEVVRGLGHRAELRNYTLVLVLAVIWLVFQLATDGLFLSQRNLGLLALQTTIVSLAAISAVMLIVTRNFDVSVGSAVALVGVVLAMLTVRLGWPVHWALLAALACGLAMGAWQGFWVAKVGIPSFIVTLAGMLYFRGFSLIIPQAETVAPVPDSLTAFATGYLTASYSAGLILIGLAAYLAYQYAGLRRAKRFGLVERVLPGLGRRAVPAVLCAAGGLYVAAYLGIPLLVLLLAVLVLLAELLMRRTSYGAKLYAIGGNPQAARLAGINLDSVIWRNFLIAGLAYGVTGIALTARVSGAVAGSAGLFLELDAIAAAIIGGTSLSGGRGRILGALLGALLMGSLNNGMSLMNVPTFYQESARGAVLLAAVAVDQIGRRRSL
ncbi:sugar ABC transporter permease [Nonomuraea sp. NPDC050663]|uniref:sugar ABC transporter permease n=1 Tax=Nonomuraea sp. NPDC050663 TaxID=3364370 RepID=UPI0037B38BEF